MNIKRKYTETIGFRARECVCISFGKIKNPKGRRCLEVEVKIALDQEDNFSASANVWNATHSDIIMGGQCLDEINVDELLPMYRNDFQIIKNIWKRYHLNDLQAGSPRQRKFVEENEDKFSSTNFYDDVCKLLKEVSLYEDEEYMYPYKDKDGNITKKPYRYGSAWLKEEIPQNVIEYIRKIINS